MTPCPRCHELSPRADWCIRCGELPEPLPDDVAAELYGERATKAPHEKWLPAERARLLELATRERSGTDIAEILTAEFGTVRTLKSVKHQLERLGVSKPRVRGKKRPKRKAVATGGAPGKRWTEEELSALHDGEVKIVGTSRTPAAIAAKRSREGISRYSEGWMTISEVAREYKAPRRRVQRLVQWGQLPAVRVNSRLVLIDPADAERLMPILRKPKRTWKGEK